MGKIIVTIVFTLYLLGIVGWCMSVYKFVHCDFESPYKAEVIYGVGTFTGLGVVVGYLNFGK